MLEQPTGDAERLTHLDDRGGAHMVHIGEKPVTARRATAIARLCMSPAAHAALLGGHLEKGDALAVARIAGIQAAKRTAEWIPLCHPLPIDAVEVDIDTRPASAPPGNATTAACGPAGARVLVRVTVQALARTGVEMEALVGAGAAALTLYDMLKAVDRAMVIEELRLETKHGGRRGDFVHPRSAVAGAPTKGAEAP